MFLLRQKFDFVAWFAYLIRIFLLDLLLFLLLTFYKKTVEIYPGIVSLMNGIVNIKSSLIAGDPLVKALLIVIRGDLEVQAQKCKIIIKIIIKNKMKHN